MEQTARRIMLRRLVFGWSKGVWGKTARSFGGLRMTKKWEDVILCLQIPFLEGKTARSFGGLRMTMMGERRPRDDTDGGSLLQT